MLAADGTLLARHRTDDGVRTLAERSGRGRERAFDEALRGALDPWSQPDLPVVACGMVGSTAGWVDTPYTRCPADLVATARELTPVRWSRGIVHVVPGLKVDDETPDVLRGEETQVLGVLLDAPRDARTHRLVVLPGTHTKWVEVVGTSVLRFVTAMTGELHELLLRDSVLAVGRAGRQTHASRAPHAFTDGLALAMRRPGALSTVFAARAAVVTGRIDPEEVSEYLSGLLIGQEVGELRGTLALNVPVTLVGAPELCRRYAAALKQRGVDVSVHQHDPVPRALLHIARESQLIPQPEPVPVPGGDHDDDE
ncbi:2-dehydro-3-deoxygalactonokinase [Actinotalea sp. K2]|nr:2-dehydro-3-deoxygalactonokinase [Actinotalea sp. K2]